MRVFSRSTSADDELEDVARFFAGYDDYTVLIADDHVAGHHDRVAARDREIHFAGTILVASTGAHGATESGEAECGDAVHVANRAVDDYATELRADGRAAHELTEYGARRIAVRVDDDDVAGLRDFERLVDHEVVGRAAHRP